MTDHPNVVRLDADNSFRCVKAVVGGAGRRLAGRKPFPEYRENFVFEPDVRIMIVTRFKRTGLQPLD